MEKVTIEMSIDDAWAIYRFLVKKLEVPLAVIKNCEGNNDPFPAWASDAVENYSIILSLLRKALGAARTEPEQK